jgi:hypothetical protein
MVIDEPKKKEKEPTHFMLSNPDRLIPTQIPYISVVDNGNNQRYVPVDRRLSQPVGIIVLMDNDPSAPDQVSKGMVI